MPAPSLPVTTATGERSFSELKYAKNYLRSTMTEVRVNGLAHMFINRDIKLNYDVIIDISARRIVSLSFSCRIELGKLLRNYCLA